MRPKNRRKSATFRPSRRGRRLGTRGIVALFSIFENDSQNRHEALRLEAGRIPAALVFAAVTGDAACGLAPDGASDFDLRAAHVLPTPSVLGLRVPAATVAHSAHRDGLDIEVLSQDIHRLALALVKKNGQVIEHVCSPLVVASSPAHEELATVALACACRHWSHHYLSHARLLRQAARTQQNFARALRVLRTGVHLMGTGEVVMDAARFKIERPAQPDAPEPENADSILGAAVRQLEEARDASPLPAVVTEEARERLNDWLVRTRLALG